MGMALVHAISVPAATITWQFVWPDISIVGRSGLHPPSAILFIIMSNTPIAKLMSLKIASISRHISILNLYSLILWRFWQFNLIDQ